jgi:hypothetical protein
VRSIPSKTETLVTLLLEEVKNNLRRHNYPSSSAIGYYGEDPKSGQKLWSAPWSASSSYLITEDGQVVSRHTRPEGGYFYIPVQVHQLGDENQLKAVSALLLKLAFCDIGPEGFKGEVNIPSSFPVSLLKDVLKVQLDDSKPRKKRWFKR